MYRLVIVSIFLIGNSFAFSQNSVEQLSRLLDSDSLSDQIYVNTSLELCKKAFQTEKEYLIGHYAPGAINRAKTSMDIEAECKLYYYLGTALWKSGNYAQSAKVFTDLRVEAESTGNLRGRLESFNGLGNVSYFLEDYTKALSYYREGLKESGSDSTMLVKFYHNIANVYAVLKQMDSVVAYYNKSVNYYTEHKEWSGLALAYSNLARAYEEQKKGMETRSTMDLALLAAEKSEDPYQMATVYQAMGEMILNRHPEIAIRFLQLSTENSLKAKAHTITLENQKNIAKIYSQLGLSKKAYDLLSSTVVLKDSLTLLKDSVNLVENERDYRFKMQQIEADKDFHQKELEQVKASNRQQMIILFLGLALLALIPVSFLFYQNYRIKASMNETRRKFFSLIAHDLKSPISGMAGLVGVIREDIIQNGRPGEKRRIEALAQSVWKVQDLLDNLLDWSRAESKVISFLPEELNLNAMVTDIANLYEDTLVNKVQKVMNQVPVESVAHADNNMLRAVLRNLLSNAIKFSPEGTTITVSAEHTGGETLVTVTDQGIGMDQKLADKLFHKDHQYTSQGTRKESGTGLGLKICAEFIRRHGGRIWAESNKGEGCRFLFTLPDTQPSPRV